MYGMPDLNPRSMNGMTGIIPSAEVKHLIYIAAECGIDKNEDLFYFAVNKVFGEPPQFKDAISDIFSTVVQYIKSQDELNSESNDKLDNGTDNE